MSSEDKDGRRLHQDECLLGSFSPHFVFMHERISAFTQPLMSAVLAWEGCSFLVLWWNKS